METILSYINKFIAYDFIEMGLRFCFNNFILYVLSKKLYYRESTRKDYLFTFILIPNVVFFLCFLLFDVNIELGFALGLFAIFGIIRYRTLQVPIKEMTYLFIVIGVSVINALVSKIALMVFSNFALIAMTLVFEKVKVLKQESYKVIHFERADLIHPDKRNELILELEKRTGHSISRIDIGDIDYLKDSVYITIYYF